MLLGVSNVLMLIVLYDSRDDSKRTFPYELAYLHCHYIGTRVREINEDAKKRFARAQDRCLRYQRSHTLRRLRKLIPISAVQNTPKNSK